MKRMPHSMLAVAMVVLATLASSPAMAQHYGYGHGWGGGGGVRLGINVGVPLYWPGYYPPPYAPYPVYPYPAPVYGYPQPAPLSPSAYVEQGPDQAAAPAQAQGDWYYCADSKSYYPYVRDCAAGWQRVPAQPPVSSVPPPPPPGAPR
jgi:hypothetical protein